MPKINPINPEKADAKTSATLQAVRKQLGLLPNIVTTFAQSPDALNGYVRLGKCLAGGRLTARQREQIALAAARQGGSMTAWS